MSVNRLTALAEKFAGNLLGTHVSQWRRFTCYLASLSIYFHPILWIYFKLDQMCLILKQYIFIKSLKRQGSKYSYRLKTMSGGHEENILHWTKMFLLETANVKRWLLSKFLGKELKLHTFFETMKILVLFISLALYLHIIKLQKSM